MAIFGVERIKNRYVNQDNHDRYFKQININDKVQLYSRYWDEKNIVVDSAVLNIKSMKLIDTIEGVSFEGQRLSGKKLVICGYVNIKFYVKISNRCFCIIKDIPISTFIVVPKDTLEDDTINVYYSIEDITTIKIECAYMFISVTIFLEYIKSNLLKQQSN